MKNEWQAKSLDDLCHIEYGTRVVRKKDSGIEYPVYGGGGATFYMDTYNREDQLVVSRFAVSEKCVRFVKGKFFLNDSGLTVKPRNCKEISQQFLDYQLLSLNNQIYNLAKGTAQKNLDVPAFKKLKIKFPASLEEQMSIVSALEKMSKKVELITANVEKSRLKANSLFEAYSYQTFFNQKDDWIHAKISEVATVEKKQGKIENLPYVGLENIESNSSVLLGTMEPRSVKSSTFRFDSSHILYGRLRPYLNKVLSAEFTGHCSTEIFPIKASQRIEKKLLFYWLKNKKTVDLINKTCTGARMPRANMKEVLNFKIYYPKSKDEQKNLVDRFDVLSNKIGRLEKLYNEKLNNLESLKKSLFHAAFNTET